MRVGCPPIPLTPSYSNGLTVSFCGVADTQVSAKKQVAERSRKTLAALKKQQKVRIVRALDLQ
jgi:hypothetical protein